MRPPLPWRPRRRPGLPAPGRAPGSQVCESRVLRGSTGFAGDRSGHVPCPALGTQKKGCEAPSSRRIEGDRQVTSEVRAEGWRTGFSPVGSGSVDRVLPSLGGEQMDPHSRNGQRSTLRPQLGRLRARQWPPCGAGARARASPCGVAGVAGCERSPRPRARAAPPPRPNHRPPPPCEPHTCLHCGNKPTRLF